MRTIFWMRFSAHAGRLHANLRCRTRPGCVTPSPSRRSSACNPLWCARVRRPGREGDLKHKTGHLANRLYRGLAQKDMPSLEIVRLHRPESCRRQQSKVGATTRVTRRAVTDRLDARRARGVGERLAGSEVGRVHPKHRIAVERPPPERVGAWIDRGLYCSAASSRRSLVDGKDRAQSIG